MIKVLIITVTSLILDGITSLYISYFPNSLSLFICNFTLISILYSNLILNKKIFLFNIMIASFIYDLLYTDIFLYSNLIYFLIYLIMNKFKINNVLLYFLLYIFIYNLINYLLYGLIYQYINIIYLFKIYFYSLITSFLYINILMLFKNKKLALNS